MNLKKTLISALATGMMLSSSYALAAPEGQNTEQPPEPNSVVMLGDESGQDKEVIIVAPEDYGSSDVSLFTQGETPADIIREAAQKGVCPPEAVDSGFGAYECAQKLNAIQSQGGESKEEQLANAISANGFLAEFLSDEEKESLALSGLAAGAGYITSLGGWAQTPELALTLEDMLVQRLDAGMSWNAAVQEITAVKGQEVARLKDIILKTHELYEYMPDSLMQAVSNARLDIARLKDMMSGSGVSSTYTEQVARDISNNMTSVLRANAECWEMVESEARVMASEYEAVQQMAASRSPANTAGDIARLRLTAKEAGGLAGLRAGVQYALATGLESTLLAVGAVGACAGAAATRGISMYMDYAEDKKKFIEEQMEAIEDGDEPD